MDSLLKGIFGGNDDDHQNRLTQAQDFVSRYETGDPAEGYSDDEALRNYDQVANQLSPEEFQQAATQAFERMSPQQRQEFATMLQQHGTETGLPLSSNGAVDDPSALARLTGQIQQQQPSGLAGLFGGGQQSGGGLGGMLSSLTGGGQQSGGGLGGMLGGLTGGGQTGGMNQAQGGNGLAGLMSNPIAKAALGGIAAMAFKQMMSRH